MRTQQTDFTIYYDGEALQGSRMNVRDLAPALLAFGDLLDAANRVLNKDKSTVQVSVKAFSSGCFGISFEVAQSFASSVWGMLQPGEPLRNGLEILGLLGFSVGGLYSGLWQLIKKSQGKKPKRIVKIESQVSMHFEYDDGTSEDIVIEQGVADLYEDKVVREAAYNIVTPLQQDNIDGLYIMDNGKLEPLVLKDEVPYFSLSNYEVEMTVDEIPQTRVLSIVSLSFKDGNKWRLSDGTLTFNAIIKDKAFLSTINTRQTEFAKGDMLRVKMIARAFSTVTGLRTEYEVVEVIQHIKSPHQLRIDR